MRSTLSMQLNWSWFVKETLPLVQILKFVFVQHIAAQARQSRLKQMKQSSVDCDVIDTPLIRKICFSRLIRLVPLATSSSCPWTAWSVIQNCMFTKLILLTGFKFHKSAEVDTCWYHIKNEGRQCTASYSLLYLYAILVPAKCNAELPLSAKSKF